MKAVSTTELDTDAQPADSIISSNKGNTDSQAHTEQSEPAQQLENLLLASVDELADQVLNHIGDQLAATLTSHRSDAISSLSVAIEGYMAVTSLDSRVKTEALQSTVAVALERCKVNVGVTAFPAAPPYGGNENTVAPLVRHGERLHDRFNVRCGGGTPLAESLWWVMQRMYGLPENRKIIVILSDREPDSLTSAGWRCRRGLLRRNL